MSTVPTAGHRAELGKQPVSAALAGPYGHPRHPMLIPIPIGAWITALIFDIGSHIVDDPGFLTRGAEWLIAIGILGALAAATAGFLDLLAIPSATRARRTALLHMSLNLAVTIAFAINFAWRHGSYTDGHAVSAGMLALSAVSLAVLACSGYLGGRLAYRYGVRVADEGTQAEASADRIWRPEQRSLTRRAPSGVRRPEAGPALADRMLERGSLTGCWSGAP